MNKWRTGSKVGRTIYDSEDQLIGMMDWPSLAAQVVEAVNNQKDLLAEIDELETQRRSARMEADRYRAALQKVRGMVRGIGNPNAGLDDQRRDAILHSIDQTFLDGRAETD